MGDPHGSTGRRPTSQPQQVRCNQAGPPGLGEQMTPATQAVLPPGAAWIHAAMLASVPSQEKFAAQCRYVEPGLLKVPRGATTAVMLEYPSWLQITLAVALVRLAETIPQVSPAAVLSSTSTRPSWAPLPPISLTGSASGTPAG